MTKMTTLNPSSPSGVERSRDVQWAEIRLLFPVYLAMAKQLEIEAPFPREKRNFPEKIDPELFTQAQTWFDSMDQRVLVYQLRQLLQTTTLNASETGLCALIHRYLRKSVKTTADRDKIDFLLVQYFALCAPAKIYHKQIELEDVAQVMKPVLGQVDVAPIEWCQPLEKIITTLRGFRSLREMLKINFIEQGRRVKESAGGMFYDAISLVTFTRFNFLLRRTFIELMHADLIAIRSGLAQLDSAAVRSINCQHFGLSSAEPLAKIREIADEWKQPFQQEYTQLSVNQAFEKLLGLRTDVENALEKIAPKKTLSAGGLGPNPAVPVAPAKPAAQQKPVESARETARQQLAAAASPAESGPALDFELCLEQIWEQLIAAPPSRGRSMTTVKIGSARILMSSWEVTAFVSENSSSADDLRRAVVARAMVTAATESAKQSGNATGLDGALSIARIEVSRLQERVDIAKQAKDTEAAVNLGISTKRLLSALDEAEKL